MSQRRPTGIRDAVPRDIPRLAVILAANDEPIAWPDLAGWPYLEHLVGRDRGRSGTRVKVAEAEIGIGGGSVDGGGEVVGFGGSVIVGDDVRFVTDLFVDPTDHERGIGRALLEALVDGASGRMTFSSGDDRALGLYLRAGMRPWWPLLCLSATAPPPLDSIEIEPADAAEAARWSGTWTGVERLVDFAHYSSLPDASAFLVRYGDAVVAAGLARRHRTRPGRWLDHASIAPDADPLRAGLGVWMAAAAGGRLTAAVPGPHPMVPWLLDRGARIVDRDTFCATDPGLVDPLRLLPNPGLL